MEKRAGRYFWVLCRTILLIGLGFMILFPFLFMFISAFRDVKDNANPSVVWITRTWTLEHVRAVWEGMGYAELMGYTAQISLVSAVFQTFVCGIVGYGFARFTFPLKRILFTLVIATIIVPPQTYLIPLFMVFRFFEIPGISWLIGLFKEGAGQWNLLDTPLPFWIQSVLGMGYRSGVFIFIYRQFFRGLPQELEDAAAIDGCGQLSAYFRVMLPNAKSAMATVGIFSFIWHWNDYFMTSMLSMSKVTVSTALANINSMLQSNLAASGADAGLGGGTFLLQIQIQAAALLTVLPMLVLFIVAQRFLTEGIERTGIVG
jgi:multiple sugar transport system permease protein